MKTLFTACFIILSFSFNCFAMWALISTDELVKESDLIVIGTLQSVSRYTRITSIIRKEKSLWKKLFQVMSKQLKVFLSNWATKLNLNGRLPL